MEAMLGRQQALGALSEPAAAELRARAARAMGSAAEPAVWATRSTMLAAATLMIAAESLGVAATLMDEFEPEQVKAAFGVPDDHTVCALIALGFPREVRPVAGRFGLEEVCYEEHFGQPWRESEPE
jgi:nitroreductase